MGASSSSSLPLPPPSELKEQIHNAVSTAVAELKATQQREQEAKQEVKLKNVFRAGELGKSSKLKKQFLEAIQPWQRALNAKAKGQFLKSHATYAGAKEG